MKKIVKRLSIAALIAIMVALIASAAFNYGYRQGTQHPDVVVLNGVKNLEKGKETDADFSLFWEAWKTLRAKYVDSDSISDQKLVYGAISGLLGATKDPYSVFMPPTQATDFNQEISGEFGGIGAEIGVRKEQLVVIAPLKGTPAEAAGIKAGDYILKINGTSTAGLSSDEAVRLIRGEKGTKVTLTLYREGWNAEKDVSITRDAIQIPTLDWKMLNDQGKADANGKILYIQLYNFYEKAPLLFYEALVNSAGKNPQAVILDLRNNPGGYLDGAVNIAGWFLDRGSVVVSEKFRTNGHDTTSSKAMGLPVFAGTPTVVLINQGSASAAEILAGALHDDRGVKLVGKKSFGKGSVQELVPISSDALIKITVAHWLTPKGTLIDKNGIAPDIAVDISDEDILKGRDPQLQKAVETIKSEMK